MNREERRAVRIARNNEIVTFTGVEMTRKQRRQFILGSLIIIGFVSVWGYYV